MSVVQLLLYPSTFRTHSKIIFAGNVRFVESSISFMFSISISNITWIRHKTESNGYAIISCNIHVRHLCYRRNAWCFCFFFFRLSIFVIRPNVLTTWKWLCSIHNNEMCAPVWSISMKPNSIWSMFKYMTASLARFQIMCVYVVCMRVFNQSDSWKKNTKYSMRSPNCH